MCTTCLEGPKAEEGMAADQTLSGRSWLGWMYLHNMIPPNIYRASALTTQHCMGAGTQLSLPSQGCGGVPRPPVQLPGSSKMASASSMLSSGMRHRCPSSVPILPQDPCPCHASTGPCHTAASRWWLLVTHFQ